MMKGCRVKLDSRTACEAMSSLWSRTGDLTDVELPQDLNLCAFPWDLGSLKQARCSG